MSTVSTKASSFDTWPLTSIEELQRSGLDEAFNKDESERVHYVNCSYFAGSADPADCSRDLKGLTADVEGQNNRDAAEESLLPNQHYSASAKDPLLRGSGHGSAQGHGAPSSQEVLAEVKRLMEAIIRSQRHVSMHNGPELTLSDINDLCDFLSLERVKVDGEIMSDRADVGREQCASDGTTTPLQCQRRACKSAEQSSNDRVKNFQGFNISAAKREESGKLLRCPYCFYRDGKPCQTKHKFVRDIVRHLSCHGVFFCAECSKSFPDRFQMEQHSCSEERLCIDPECANRPPEALAHTCRDGCRSTFHALGTRRKWYALYALMFPDSAPPQCEDVCVPARNMNDSKVSPGEPSQPTSATITKLFRSPVPRSYAANDADNLAVPKTAALDDCAEWSACATKVETVDVSHRFREHVIYLMEQIGYILHYNAAQISVIAEQNQKHEQQEITNSNHEERIRELERKLEGVYRVMAASVQHHDQHIIHGDMQLDGASQ